MTFTVNQVADLLARHRYSWSDEGELHEQLAAVLTAAGATVHTEVALDPTCRIDLLVDRVGIEVKVKGTPEAVLRQLQRYSHSDRVDHLVLATTRAAHRALPAMIGGKPLTVAYLTHIT